MPRKFSKESYQYIQGWLKDRYKSDPEFKKKANENTSFCYLRNKVKKMVDITTLDVLIEIYTNPTQSTAIIVNV
jgi:hypothetical protein